MYKDKKPRVDEETEHSRLLRRSAYPFFSLLPAIAAALLLVTGLRQAAAGDGISNPPVETTSADTRVTATRRDYLMPGTQPHTLVDAIPNPTECRACHSEPIYGAWRGSMMSQAGRDPLFWSALAVANQDVEGVGDFCLRCHAPKGWLEGRSHPTDGSGLLPADLLGGIACEVCHRMVDPKPGATDETAALDIAIRSALTMTLPADHVSSAMLVMDPQDNRRGPFSLTDPAFPFHTAYQSTFLGQSVDSIASSRLCGTCHNVDNPLLSWTESPPGGGPAQYWPNNYDEPAPSFANGRLFPIERTFDEWLNSAYVQGVYAPQFAGAKRDGIVSSCQDCHMRRNVGLAAAELSPDYPVYRSCGATGCLPTHTLVGGNTWVPQILQDTRWRLHAAADAPYLEQAIIEARGMLRQAATLQVSLTGSGAQKTATVRVINETGHKLPTGYPEGRRMWLNLRAYDRSGRLIYESGVYNSSDGTLVNDPSLKVYEAKQGLTPELARVVNLPAGPSFHFALNNAIIKDNRIPPRGYTIREFDKPGLRPVGASYADGQHWDETRYAVPGATARVVATLYYQTSSGEYIDFLRRNGGADGQALGRLWQDSKSPPEVMAVAAFPPPNNLFIPLVGGRMQGR